jgi:CheY-like chemotaxis protein
MVVEDEPEIYELLLAMFEMWGIEGVAFVDGEEAVAWIEDVNHNRFQGELPELALLDIRLPGEINGIQVGENLRKSPILGKIAIVMTTAFKLNEKEKTEALRQTQADLWLPKPLPKFKELQGILENIIADRRAKNKAEQLKLTKPIPNKKPNEVKISDKKFTEKKPTKQIRTEKKSTEKKPTKQIRTEKKSTEEKRDD